MKKRILFIVLSLLFFARTAVHAEAYALYCEANGIITLYFLCSDTVPNGTHDGKTIVKMWWGEDVTDIQSWRPKWITSYYFSSSKITRVVFEESFKDARPTKLFCWFYRYSNLTSVEGIENLNTSNVRDMGGMFDGCSGLTSLDLSSFNTSSVTDMDGMFYNCHVLEKLDLRNVTGDIGKLANHEDINKRGMVILVPEETDLSGEVSEENYIVKPESGTSFIRTFDDAGLQTLYLPFAVDAKANGTFYKYHDYAGSEVTFMSVEDAATEANTAYLFRPKNSGKTVFTSCTVLTEHPENIGEGAASGLYGVYTTTELVPAAAPTVGYYELTDGDFCKAGSETTVIFNRAYLKIADADAPARLTLKLVDASTGISSVSASGTDASAPAYNMQGQRIGGSYKGIVIKNGKKVVL